jgi:hypothetical protein
MTENTVCNECGIIGDNSQEQQSLYYNKESEETLCLSCASWIVAQEEEDAWEMSE